MHLTTLGIREHNTSEWEIIFHDEFIPEFKNLSRIVQNELVALTLNLCERAAAWTAAGRYAQGIAPRQHEGVAL
jgi:hypothetical protein